MFAPWAEALRMGPAARRAASRRLGRRHQTCARPGLTFARPRALARGRDGADAGGHAQPLLASVGVWAGVGSAYWPATAVRGRTRDSAAPPRKAPPAQGALRLKAPPHDSPS